MGSQIARDGLTLVEAARLLPGRPHKNTLRRWWRDGYRGVRLQCFRVGRTIFTTEAAVDEFLRVVNDLPRMDQAQLQAEKHLASLGIQTNRKLHHGAG